MELEVVAESVELYGNPSLHFDFLAEKHLDILGTFVCDDEPSVSKFLREDAYKLDNLGMTRTRLYFDEHDSLVGFFSLFVSTTNIDRDKMIEKGFAVPEDYRLEFPTVTLYYLGVDSRHRDKRIGRRLFLDVLDICEYISTNSGCRFLMLEALESSKWFYDHYGLITLDCQIEQNEDFSLYRLYTMALPLYEIDERVPMDAVLFDGVAL